MTSEKKAERGQPSHQHPLAPDVVAHHPEGKQQADEYQRVGVDRQLELTLAGPRACTCPVSSHIGKIFTCAMCVDL